MDTSCTFDYWKIIPIVTAWLSLIVIYANARFGIRNKQSDMIIHFHKQFDEIQKKRCELLIAQAEMEASSSSTWSLGRKDVEVEMFYDRFWSLQFDEFLAWYEGYIPTSLYIYWVFSRWRELHEPSKGWTFNQKTLASALDDLEIRWRSNPDKTSKQSIHLTKFLTLMLALKTNGASVDVEGLLKSVGPSYVRQWTRKVFGAY